MELHRNIQVKERQTQEPKGVAKRVYRQLLPDFPAPALEFVKRTEWIGPVAIPTDQIDFSNRANWAASHEPEKVQKHIELIKNDKSMPVILAKLPGHDKFVCLDAHHRLLAYEAMDEEPVCYVGFVSGSDAEAALTMHSKQYHGGSKLNGTGGKIDAPNSDY